MLVGAETNTRDPVGVVLVVYRVLAVSERVPELDRFVARRRDDLAVIGGEGNRQNIFRVADKSLGGRTGG